MASPSRTPPTFLPPQPLADRDRRRGPFGWLGRRAVAALTVGAVLALGVPVVVNALGSSGDALKPLAGNVAGAVPGSHEPVASDPPGSAKRPVADSRLALTRSTDADAPPAMADRVPAPVASLTGYRWPLSEGRVSLPFKPIPGGEWLDDGVRMHDGVDLASFCGARVGAAHSGVVIAAGRHFDDQIGWLGNLRPYYRLLDSRNAWGTLPIAVVIDDGNGYRSIYAHFRDVSVRVGQTVRAGQTIGHEGATGHASGCHVHYGIFSPLETHRFALRSDIRVRMKLPRYEIARIDPLQVLPRGDVALKTRQIAKAIAASKKDRG